MTGGAGGLAACLSDRGDLLAARAAGERLMALSKALDSDPAVLLTQEQGVEAFRHYPAGDVYDLTSHAQYYYHSHRDGEFGHIHLFQRPRGMARGLAPVTPPKEADAPCHLIGVGLGPWGEAVELFTTNRWVTGEAWYPAEAVKTMVAGLRLAPPGPWLAVSQWLAGLVAFYRPLIEVLIDERDRAVEAWRMTHPGRDVFNDERLEITSTRTIDPAADLAQLGG
ncbi:hypothetical protein CCC_02620 [Paramagnetospirillum magnetotacticum MS-1]|uniref:DUF6969 domain-containing protein n=1 Tax=Paramagnetospirillum magnetotacticum MS-1 TaxID=272627 RepID=A0A0C2V424_PARME|nr:hypothetical protein [Paramagnetospirillum magnetotacticum]KIL99831.1 hypothetical protein CCC_02620 [Paramagnetospirillum magnetotacticum MS-1]